MTRPAASVIRHCRVASNTLASPLMVIGDETVSFSRGVFNVIAPFADVTGDGAGDAVGDGGGVADGPAVPAEPHAARASASRSASERLITITNADAGPASPVPDGLRAGGAG